MPKLEIYYYDHPPFGHHAMAIVDDDGTERFFSFHSDTQEHIQARQIDPNYKIPGETNPDFREEDLPDRLLDFWRRQLKPIIGSKGYIVTDPSTLPPPTKVTQINIDNEEKRQLKIFFDKTQRAVDDKKLGYSLFQREGYQHCTGVVYRAIGNLEPKPPTAVATVPAPSGFCGIFAWVGLTTPACAQKGFENLAKQRKAQAARAAGVVPPLRLGSASRAPQSFLGSLTTRAKNAACNMSTHLTPDDRYQMFNPFG